MNTAVCAPIGACSTETTRAYFRGHGVLGPHGVVSSCVATHHSTLPPGSSAGCRVEVDERHFAGATIEPSARASRECRKSTL
jgi:hypothetical protein